VSTTVGAVMMSQKEFKLRYGNGYKKLYADQSWVWYCDPNTQPWPALFKSYDSTQDLLKFWFPHWSSNNLKNIWGVKGNMRSFVVEYTGRNYPPPPIRPSAKNTKARKCRKTAKPLVKPFVDSSSSSTSASSSSSSSLFGEPTGSSARLEAAIKVAEAGYQQILSRLKPDAPKNHDERNRLQLKVGDDIAYYANGIPLFENLRRAKIVCIHGWRVFQNNGFPFTLTPHSTDHPKEFEITSPPERRTPHAYQLHYFTLFSGVDQELADAPTISSIMAADAHTALERIATHGVKITPFLYTPSKPLSKSSPTTPSSSSSSNSTRPVLVHVSDDDEEDKKSIVTTSTSSIATTSTSSVVTTSTSSVVTTSTSSSAVANASSVTTPHPAKRKMEALSDLPCSSTRRPFRSNAPSPSSPSS
jgi:hypothetical protein